MIKESQDPGFTVRGKRHGMEPLLPLLADLLQPLDQLSRQPLGDKIGDNDGIGIPPGLCFQLISDGIQALRQVGSAPETLAQKTGSLLQTIFRGQFIVDNFAGK